MNRVVSDSVFDGDGLKDIFDEFEEYQEGADSGDCRSLVRLGQFYKDGKVLSEDQIAAFECFLEAAESGDAEAEYELAKCYYEGIGTPQNRTQGFRLLLSSSRNGNLDATSYLGALYLNGDGVVPNVERGLEMIMGAAEKGCATAKVQLAHIYKEGVFVPCDTDRYIEYLTEAAELGDVTAQFELGEAYAQGWLVKGDLEKSVKWLTRASDAGEGAATFELASIIHEQDPTDEEAFRRMLLLRNQLANVDMLLGAARITYDFLPVKFGEAENVTTEFLETAMEMGSGEAAHTLGCKYDTDLMLRDHRKAFELYRRAADMGYVKAIGKVGKCYETGCGIEKDPYQAEAWYSRGDAENDAYSQFHLGIMKINGTGIDCHPDYNAAIKLMKKAFANGEKRAATVLAEWYENIEDLKCMGESVYWYKRGAAALEPKSMDRLAQHYLSGTYIHESQEMAFNIYKDMVEKTESTNIGHANLGKFYEEGLYVDADQKKARTHYKKAAAKGNAFAMYRLSEMAKAKNSDDEMIFWLIASASRGNVTAMMELARRYETGDGIVRSHPNAVEFYHRATEKGNDEAKDELERVLLEECVCEDTSEYLDLLYKTANGRHGSNLLILADMRLNGTGGTRRNKTIARMWCKIAKMYDIDGTDEMLEMINTPTKA